MKEARLQVWMPVLFRIIVLPTARHILDHPDGKGRYAHLVLLILIPSYCYC